MEIGDVIAPLLSRLLARLSRLLSWLLVSLVGGGLGLIYKGIRQSLQGPAARAGGEGGETWPGQRARGSGRSAADDGAAADGGFFYGFA